MRFGIMAMQTGMLIPPHKSPAELMAHFSTLTNAEVVRQLHANGFNLIELGGDLSLFLPNSFSPAAIEELGLLKEEKGISYTVHLPLWSVETSTPLQPVRQGSVQAVIDILKDTLPLQPECYVLHATGALAAEFTQMRISPPAKAFLLRMFQSGAAESLKTILGETGIPSRQLAIETIEFPFELTQELAEKFDLSFCLDTGHVLAGFSGPLGLFDALEACLPRLGNIHLHDAPWQGEARVLGYGKDHQALGKGDLDLPRFLDRLERAAYAGPIIFELTLPEALESLEAVRAVRPDLITRP